MHTHRSRGFTLIELLVVISIIGILSAVVLASLNTARQKGNDAAIQSDLSTVQTEAEIFYGGSSGNTSPNTYGATVTSCTDAAGMFMIDSVIKKAVAGAETVNGSGTTMACFGDGNAYAISSPLSSDSSKFWCVDSTGSVGIRASAAVSTVCPAT